MKIYQLHEYSGEWEDFRDNIIGSYLRRERAEEEKAKAEAKEKELIECSDKCDNCPFLERDFDKPEDLLLEFPDYCEKAELEETDYGIKCLNYYVKMIISNLILLILFMISIFRNLIIQI